MARNLNNRQNKSSALKKRIPVPQKPPKVEDTKKKYDRNKTKREQEDLNNND